MFNLFRSRGRYKFIIGAIFRNEVEYVLEWVAWYFSQGAEKLVIYGNQSDDGTYELLVRLASLCNIEVYRIERCEGAQIKAYKRIFESCKSSTEFIGFVDADEFLVSQTDKTASDLLSNYFNDRSVGAIGVNWRVFRSSGEEHYTPGLVIERFKKAATDDSELNHYFKSIYRSSALKNVGCHCGSLKRKYKYKYIDT